MRCDSVKPQQTAIHSKKKLYREKPFFFCVMRTNEHVGVEHLPQAQHSTAQRNHHFCTKQQSEYVPIRARQHNTSKKTEFARASMSLSICRPGLRKYTFAHRATSSWRCDARRICLYFQQSNLNSYHTLLSPSVLVPTMHAASDLFSWRMWSCWHLHDISLRLRSWMSLPASLHSFLFCSFSWASVAGGGSRRRSEAPCAHAWIYYVEGLVVPGNSNLFPSGLGRRPERMFVYIYAACKDEFRQKSSISQLSFFFFNLLFIGFIFLALLLFFSFPCCSIFIYALIRALFFRSFCFFFVSRYHMYAQYHGWRRMCVFCHWYYLVASDTGWCTTARYVVPAPLVTGVLLLSSYR